MFNNLLEIPYKTAQEYGDRISHQYYADKKLKQHTFKDFTHNIGVLTGGFKKFGLEPEDHVSFFVNNRYDWIVTDFALMALQTVSVPRGSDSTPKELQFIFHHSDSQWLILENTIQLKELLGEFTQDDWQKCKGIFLVDWGELADTENLTAELKDKIFFYDQIKEKGRAEFDKDPHFIENQIKKIDSQDVMTIVYTSGTTGNPKGVMLTHRNFLQNVEANTPRLQIDPEKAEKTVVMLPSWHVYERAFEFCAIHSALTLHYSSAPRFAQDLLEVKPEVIISVPRVWESIYQKMLKAISKMPGYKRLLIFFFVKCNQLFLSSSLYLKGGYISLKKRSLFRKFWASLYRLILFALTWPGHHMSKVLFKPFRERVGGRLRAATSAAGALPKYLDELFNALGIPIVNAYGMTECAPGIMSRTLDCNTFGTVGIPFNNTRVEIRREDGTLTDIGEKGVLFAKGEQVMPGYYKNPEATAKAIQDGWMNTGDLAVWSENGEAVIVGRLKDTIVLMGGENVEPEPIEEKIKESHYIDHAVVMGQDQKQLSAIVALNEEKLMELAKELKLSPSDVVLEGKESIEHDIIYRVIMKEVHQLVSREHGFKSFEFISKVFPVKNDFSIGKELTQTLKIKRKYIEERYHGLVNKLMNEVKKRRK